MKLRLILVAILMLPLLVKGQTGVVFYSKAPIYVKYKDTESDATKGESSSTTLYISGSAKFVNGSAIKQKGRTEITQDFINGKDPTDVDSGSRNLFIDKSPADNVKTGVVAFIGKGDQQADPADGGTLKNRATLQRIYGELPVVTVSPTTITQQKTINWINFPTITIEKGLPTHSADDWRDVGYLMVDTTAALSVDYVRAKRGDRFAVNAVYNPTNPRIINSGHARIINTAIDTDLPTYSQLNLKLYKYNGDGAANDDGAFDETGGVGGRPIADPLTYQSGNGTLRNTDGWNYLTGITSPFAELGADYMFYHALVKPNGISMTSYKGPIVDPFYRLQNGVGYFTSMEVSHNDHEAIDKHWDFEKDYPGTSGIHHSKRARGGYVFNRLVFHDYLAKPGGVMDNLSRFYFDVADHNTIQNSTGTRPIAGLGDPEFIEKDPNDGQMKDRSRYEQMLGEKFNTEQSQIVVSLSEGLNFLGNPFMVPISLNPLLGYYADGQSMGFPDPDFEDGVDMPAFTPQGSSNVTVSSVSSDANIRSKYWLINEALIKYDDTNDLFLYKTKYDFISRDGATITAGVGNTQGTLLHGITPLEYRIAPMQMFCLQASGNVDIKLDMAELGAFGKTNFLKSATADSENSILNDWFVIEAVSNKDNTADRASVIFRERASTKYNQDPFDTRKGLTAKMEEYVPEYNGHKTRTKLEASTGIVYTKSMDGEKLLGNAVPGTVKEMALYFIPPTKTQEVTLRFLGVENVHSVPGVWLIDRHLNNKKIRIYPGDEYIFISEASNAKEADAESRFILRYYDSVDDIITGDDDPITCYYNSSYLYIKGLHQDDVGSDVQIYDLQGRLMGKTKVSDTSMEYFKPLSIGTYIVKIIGKRNHTTKFVNLKN
ncbi:MAG: T9SS type A sorting domain-containing protein [Dysgonomonas sp.]